MLKKYIRDKNGIAALEFALIAPVLMLIVLGLFDYGMYIRNIMQTENIVRASVQYLAEADNDSYDNPTQLKSDLMTDIIEPASIGISEGNVTIPDTLPVCQCFDGTTVDCTAGDCGEDDYIHRYVEVSITHEHEAMIPYPGVSESITISKSMRWPIEVTE